MKKKLTAIAAALLCLSMLMSGCGKKATPEDAQTYVQATLDAYYKGDYDAYMEKTKCTEDEAKAMHDEILQANLDASGLESMLDDETVEKLRQLFSDLFNNCKYTVSNAQEDGDGFTVEVTVEPFKLNYDQMLVDMEAAVSEVDPETAANMTEDEAVAYAMDLMFNIMSEKVTSPEYGEAETFTVHIQPDDDGVLTASEDDLYDISNSLVVM